MEWLVEKIVKITGQHFGEVQIRYNFVSYILSKHKLMNGIRSLWLTTGLFALLLTGCGPSAKEFEEKRVADSVGVADSLAMRQGEMSELNLSTRTPAEKKFIKTAETQFLVNNVRTASEKIEDLTVKYSGYLTYSNLQNRERDFFRQEISRDSVVISKKIVVENNIVLRIPNENLDSLVRDLNKLILFLDYRIIKMDEISFAYLANQKTTDRLKDYESRQKEHIDTKGGKLKETTAAEESRLDRQIQSDKLQVENLALADQVKYCTLTIMIYQKPFLFKETEVLLNTDSYRANLSTRILDALVDGWIMFEYFLVFLFRIWWLFVLVIGGIFVYRFLFKRKK